MGILELLYPTIGNWQLADGTLRGILKQAHITPEEFLEKYQG